LSGRGSAEENELLLAVAEESLATLGYGVAKRPRVDAQVEPEQEAQLAEVEPQAEDDAGQAEDARLAAVYEAAMHMDLESVAGEPQEPQVPQIEQAAASKAAAEEEEENYIDDEIIGIFVEEAKEVLGVIGQYFPRWVKNFGDQNALMEFRRAFHTLKGSGRMVGAHDVGELAWSIENMLNRVIDGSIHANPSQVAIIEKVRAILPQMIDAFRVKLANPVPELSEHYRLQAQALAQGLVLSLFGDDRSCAAHAAISVRTNSSTELQSTANPDGDSCFEDTDARTRFVCRFNASYGCRGR
jgi:chemosensory pili system protein ChpA (sensor histidine kinase/response regulator)